MAAVRSETAWSYNFASNFARATLTVSLSSSASVASVAVSAAPGALAEGGGGLFGLAAGTAVLPVEAGDGTAGVGSTLAAGGLDAVSPLLYCVYAKINPNARAATPNAATAMDPRLIGAPLLVCATAGSVGCAGCAVWDS